MRFIFDGVYNCFRPDKFSRIIAHTLNLYEIVQKLVPNFLSFVTGERKFNRAKIHTLYFEKVV